MATRSTYPLFKAFTSTNDPAVGYKLYTYAAGTTTPLTTYQDEAATVPHTNPIILDSLGEAEIYLSASAKFTLTDPDGAIQTGWPVDNIDPSSIAAVDVSFVPSGFVTETNVQDAMVEVIAEVAGVRTIAEQAVAASGTGLVFIAVTATVPTGYLECDGSAISRATYAALFAIISDDYGEGDGSTTFNIPDYRGRFLRGWAHGQTTDPDAATRTDRGDGTDGDVVGSKQADELKAHTHQTYQFLSNNAANGSNDYGLSAWTVTGSTGGAETRPININVMFVIKY